MKAVIAIDSFKGCISSADAGNAVAAGIRRACPNADISVFPAADGGEGTVSALLGGLDGDRVSISVHDPLGRPISAEYGILPDNTAVIEMSAASGLPLLLPEERDPFTASSYGFGEMILDACRRGCRELILGIGGSATNDGGLGCLSALGLKFLDANGQQVPSCGKGLSEVVEVLPTDLEPVLLDVRVRVACDVTNPLCGPHGCANVFAPQKGADANMVAMLDAGMRHYAEAVRRYFPDADADTPGSGAAGGLGFALRYALGASLEPGFALIAEKTGLSRALAGADLVITGEGRLDAQSVMGKVPTSVAQMASPRAAVIALCGAVGEGADACLDAGIDAYFPILRRPVPLEEAMNPDITAKNLTDTAEQVARLYFRMSNAPSQ